MPQGISWLASYPKSGNTWVRFFLTAYRFGHLNINNNIPYIRGDLDAYTYQILSPRRLKDIPYTGHLLLRHAVLLHKIYAKKYDPIILKTHHSRVSIHGIDLFPPQYMSKSVYIVRDPRDVVCSYNKHMGNKDIDLSINNMSAEDAVFQDKSTDLFMFTYSWRQHVISWNKDDTLVIRYEDIKTHPDQMFKLILKQYNLDVDDDRVTEAISLSDIERLKRQEAKDGFIEKKYQEKFFGGGEGWRNELTEEQVRRIEEENGDVMEQFDYKLEYL